MAIINWIVKRVKYIYSAVINLFRKKPKQDKDTYQWVMKQLNESFFGTLVKRDLEAGTYRYRHKEDGWRHGKSHPFEWGGEKYDKGKNIDKSVELYNNLSNEIMEEYSGNLQ